MLNEAPRTIQPTVVRNGFLAGFVEHGPLLSSSCCVCDSCLKRSEHIDLYKPVE